MYDQALGAIHIALVIWGHSHKTPSALGGTRTPNLLIRSQMLYPLSYERETAASIAAGRQVISPGEKGGGSGIRTRDGR